MKTKEEFFNKIESAELTFNVLAKEAIKSRERKINPPKSEPRDYQISPDKGKSAPGASA